MTRKVFFIFIIALLAFSFCSKDKAGAPDATGDQAAATDASGRRAGQAQNRPQDALNLTVASPLRIQAVTFQPEAPTVLDDVTAQPELADPGLKDIKFRYQWFVNGKEVLGIYGATLENTYFKKGAWLYCRVQAVSGEGESEWFKSYAIRVLNSLPVLRLAPLADFSIPVELSYQAAASDADDDALTFELLAPLDQGIVVDPKTGLLSWNINADTLNRLGETIEIKLAVSDGEGEKVTGTITLQLTSNKKTQ
jgi:hypothetical protein